MNSSNKPRWNLFRRPAQNPDTEGSSTTTNSIPVNTRSKTWETTIDRIPSWPEEARPLKRHDWVSYLFIIGDVILVLLPVYFILLGVAVVTLHGKAVVGNAFASKVMSAIQLGPTLFPIMFAAISGRSMKMIARYLAEKGAKLSTLELLMASQSVWGTVESQLFMRRLTTVGVNLLFLWALSPLGGQASLRLLEKSTNTVADFRPLRYLSTGPGSSVWAMTSGTYVESDGGLTQVEGLYAAALLGAKQAQEGPEDSWGNVKVPFLDLAKFSQNQSDAWIDVGDHARQPEDYFSLVGIPVVGRPKDRDGEFNLETSQLTVECQPFVKTMINKFDFTSLQKLVPGQLWKNMTTKNSPWGSEGIGAKTSTFFLQTDIPLTDGWDYGDGRFSSYLGFLNKSDDRRVLPKRQITYASSFGYDSLGNTTLNAANCSLGQVHVETTIKCTKSRCFATRLRPSRVDRRNENATAFDHILIAELALTAFPKTFGWSRGSNPTEQFLYNTTSFQFVSPVTSLGTNPGWVDLTLLDPKVFSRRLSLLLNTYFQLTIAPNAYMGDLSTNNMSIYGPATLPVADVDAYLPGNMSVTNTSYRDWYNLFQTKTYSDGLYFIGATTNATISQSYEIFQCNYAWLSLLLAAASTILLIGFGSLVLKRKTLGPEMFGFVTSMTYENKYIKIPEGGSMLDAMERARLLRDVEVYVGDVHGDDNVGHIALAAGVPMRKLERGRLYC